ncbi:MAG: DUF4136 domain-containing protein [Chromatiales bacterium]|nr:DUF4136 domain-containing protein [Chromatiales bacterium]
MAGKTILTALVAGLCLAGCSSSVLIETERSSAVDFSGLHTYGWQDADLPSGENGDSSLAIAMADIIRETLAEGLEGKGFVPSQQDSPDFLVSYHMVLTDEPDSSARLPGEAVITGSEAAYRVEPVPIYYHMSRVDGTPRPRKGTIIVYVLDAETKRVLWQSVAADTVVSPVSVLDRSRYAVRTMIEDFPEA